MAFKLITHRREMKLQAFTCLPLKVSFDVSVKLEGCPAKDADKPKRFVGSYRGPFIIKLVHLATFRRHERFLNSQLCVAFRLGLLILSPVLKIHSFKYRHVM